ncbi:cohesin domain-containing protein [Neolewinella agarilytica]|uniref:Cohesin domain-containing protein n=1 Tax=Neolewinella agarilytica TaxID=478744 RepID=A0A1H9EG55_9BACT|nr:cohesin domain-containing protein [Neolewinella agarilytica]SEQ24615.1 Cohesin domain-containing protein [Neolewinella agarilytica]
MQLMPFRSTSFLTILTKMSLFAGLFLLVFSCNNSAANAQTGEPVVGKVNPRSPLIQDPGFTGDKKTRALIVRMGEAKAKSGERVCLPVEATGFKDLLGFQFTMRFDSAALKYESVRGMKLPGYGVDKFGVRFADRGYVSSLWTDPDIVNGSSMPDNTKLFEICFTNLMKKGEETEVKFQDGPTAFEVISNKMEQLRLVHSNGKVVSK